MKKYLLIIASPILLLAKESQGQSTCASVFNPQVIQTSDPGRYNRYMQLEQFTANYIASLSNNQMEAGRLINPNSTIIIPVVVHVLHLAEAVGVGNNISDAQIQSQIAVLNEDFRRLNADRVNTPAAFLGAAADPNIEFRLACVDPNGNSTNGIHRVQTNINSFTVVLNANGTINEQASRIKFAAQGGTNAWPTDRYLNIWVCNITPDVNGQLLGYAQFPFDYSTSPNTDGVVILNTAFGRVGNLRFQYDQGRTTTHEVGHWLNLFHIWGDDQLSSNICSGSDQCGDTPNQGTQNQSDCPGFPHPSCNNGPNGDMFMNYMDYTIDGCKNIYTQDQTNRMRAVFASGGPRFAFINNYFHVNVRSTPICATGQVSATNLSCLPITWSVVSGPATIQSGQGTNTVTLQKTGNGPAVISAVAGGYTDETTVFFGIPQYTYEIVPSPISSYTECYKLNKTYSFTIQPTGIEHYYPNGPYQWYCTSSGILPSTTKTASLKFTSPGDYTLTVRPNNACGLGPISVYSETLHASSSCSGGYYLVSPNPVSNTLNVETIELNNYNNQSTAKNKSITGFDRIEVFDKTGNLVLRKTYPQNSKKVNFDVSSLRSDVYVVRIFNENISEEHKIIVQH